MQPVVTLMGTLTEEMDDAVPCVIGGKWSTGRSTGSFLWKPVYNDKFQLGILLEMFEMFRFCQADSRQCKDSRSRLNYRGYSRVNNRQEQERHVEFLTLVFASQTWNGVGLCIMVSGWGTSTGGDFAIRGHLYLFEQKMHFVCTKTRLVEYVRHAVWPILALEDRMLMSEPSFSECAMSSLQGAPLLSLKWFLRTSDWLLAQKTQLTMRLCLVAGQTSELPTMDNAILSYSKVLTLETIQFAKFQLKVIGNKWPSHLTMWCSTSVDIQGVAPVITYRHLIVESAPLAPAKMNVTVQPFKGRLMGIVWFNENKDSNGCLYEVSLETKTDTDEWTTWPERYMIDNSCTYHPHTRDIIVGHTVVMRDLPKAPVYRFCVVAHNDIGVEAPPLREECYLDVNEAECAICLMPLEWDTSATSQPTTRSLVQHQRCTCDVSGLSRHYTPPQQGPPYDLHVLGEDEPSFMEKKAIWVETDTTEELERELNENPMCPTGLDTCRHLVHAKCIQRHMSRGGEACGLCRSPYVQIVIHKSDSHHVQQYGTYTELEDEDDLTAYE